MQKQLADKRLRRVSTAPLPAGKLPLPLLRRLLAHYAIAGPEVKVGAAPGRDAAVIQQGNTLLIAKTDPITFVTDNIGYYALHINANDVACMGGEPKWFLTTVLLPAGKTSEKEVEQIFSQLHAACREIEVALCGGHTEITPAVSQPVVVGCLLAEAPASRNLTPQNIVPGDRLILTKGLAIEATSIIGREKHRELARLFEPEFAQRCEAFLFDPGISVLRAARMIWEAPGLRAIHDPTEGGLGNAIHELLDEGGYGVEIDAAEVPIYPETKLLCEQFRLDPFGIIASGALLLAAAESEAEGIIETFTNAGLPAAVIGSILPPGEERWLIAGRKRLKLPYFRFDEIIKVLSD